MSSRNNDKKIQNFFIFGVIELNLSVVCVLHVSWIITVFWFLFFFRRFFRNFAFDQFKILLNGGGFYLYSTSGLSSFFFLCWSCHSPPPTSLLLRQWTKHIEAKQKFKMQTSFFFPLASKENCVFTSKYDTIHWTEILSSLKHRYGEKNQNLSGKRA